MFASNSIRCRVVIDSRFLITIKRDTGRKNGFEARQMWSKYESNVIFLTFIHICPEDKWDNDAFALETNVDKHDVNARQINCLLCSVVDKCVQS